MTRLNGQNVSDFDYVPPVEVHEPRDVADVQRLIAGRSGITQPPLRVVSSGYNWGLGSASSPEERTDLISLHRLQTVREVDLDHGFAVIEAGVTQDMVSDILRDTGRLLNCTASSGRTAVVGNMLERGVGLHGQRIPDLLGLEVVLPDGTTGTVGWWPENGSRVPNPLGLGPSSLHLFTQSNLGVITAATVRLRPRPSRREVVTFSIDAASTTTVIDRLRNLIGDGVVSGVVKIYDEVASALYGAADARIVVHTCIDGPELVAAAKIDALWAAFDDLEPERVPRAAVDNDPLLSAIAHLYDGDTRGSEDIVRSALNASTEDADEHGSGWIFVLPLIPMRGEDVDRAIGIVRDATAASSVRAGTTVNALDYDTVDLVIALAFQRTPDAAAEAHAVQDKIIDELVTHGYRPYRVDTRHRREELIADPRDLDGVLAGRFKQLLDPDTVLAPSRYVATQPLPRATHDAGDVIDEVPRADGAFSPGSARSSAPS